MDMLWKRHRSVGLDGLGMNKKRARKKRAARKLQALSQDKEMRQPKRKIVPWVL